MLLLLLPALSREHIIGIHLQDDHSSYYEWVPKWTTRLRTSATDIQVPANATSVSKPLIPSTWEALLTSHPSRQLVQFFMSGISQGFRIGFKQPRKTLKSAKRNLGCALDHPETVVKYLADEIAPGQSGWPIQNVGYSSGPHK